MMTEDEYAIKRTGLPPLSSSATVIAQGCAELTYKKRISGERRGQWMVSAVWWGIRRLMVGRESAASACRAAYTTAFTLPTYTRAPTCT